jgi:dihydrofolate reductase
MANGRAIGRAGALPWHVPEDLKRFRALTTGHCIIMGRTTHQSIGRALPNRRNLVVSAAGFVPPEGVEVAGSLEQALTLAEADPLPFVIGGAQLYAAALPKATHLYLTALALDVEGADTFFPALDLREWREVKRTPGQGPEVTYVDLERLLPAR